MFFLWMINILNEALFILYLFEALFFFLNCAICHWMVSIYEYPLSVLPLLFRGKWTFFFFKKLDYWWDIFLCQSITWKKVAFKLLLSTDSYFKDTTLHIHIWTTTKLSENTNRGYLHVLQTILYLQTIGIQLDLCNFQTNIHSSFKIKQSVNNLQPYWV